MNETTPKTSQRLRVPLGSEGPHPSVARGKAPVANGQHVRRRSGPQHNGRCSSRPAAQGAPPVDRAWAAAIAPMTCTARRLCRAFANEANVPVASRGLDLHVSKPRTSRSTCHDSGCVVRLPQRPQGLLIRGIAEAKEDCRFRHHRAITTPFPCTPLVLKQPRGSRFRATETY